MRTRWLLSSITARKFGFSFWRRAEHWSLRYSGQGAITTFNRDLSSHGCDPHGNYAFIVHGWRENFATPWVNDMVTNLTVHRGGCTIFMDYSNYSSHPDYFRLVPHFSNLADLLQRKVEQVGSFDRMFMFGFSFGSRLCFEVGARLSQLGHQIDQIDACDPAGPAFDASRRAVDPKLAARNVACINTSITKGTSVYNCHQNFIMGRCGISQMGASRFPCGNHGLCPYFYNAAFSNNFTQNNFYLCPARRPILNLPEDFKMGYMEKRKS